MEEGSNTTGVRPGVKGATNDERKKERLKSRKRSATVRRECSNAIGVDWEMPARTQMPSGSVESGAMTLKDKTGANGTIDAKRENRSTRGNVKADTTKRREKGTAGNKHDVRRALRRER